MCYVVGNVKKGNDAAKIDHYRQGKTTTKLCLVCQIPICTKCNYTFHNEKNLQLPVCMKQYLDKKFDLKKLVDRSYLY